jgi:hypothetical protein
MISEAEERPTKRLKLESGEENKETKETLVEVLPPSYVLLGRLPRPTGTTSQLTEQDVGITEYVSKDLSPIEGIIKQRHVEIFEAHSNYYFLQVH